MIGMTKSVRNVVAVSPPRTVMAIGALNSAPDEVVKAMGSIPRTVVKAVSRTGLRRVEHPRRMASRFVIPIIYSFFEKVRFKEKKA